MENKKELFKDLRQKRNEAETRESVKNDNETENAEKEQWAALTRQYSEIVKDVLTQLKDALGVRAHIVESTFNWLLENPPIAFTSGAHNQNKIKYAQVTLITDKNGKPQYFLCNRFKLIFNKSKKAGLSKDELAAALNDLHTDLFKKSIVPKYIKKRLWMALLWAGVFGISAAVVEFQFFPKVGVMTSPLFCSHQLEFQSSAYAIKNESAWGFYCDKNKVLGYKVFIALYFINALIIFIIAVVISWRKKR